MLTFVGNQIPDLSDPLLRPEHDIILELAEQHRRVSRCLRELRAEPGRVLGVDPDGG